ncbi:DUF4397 domain-containing protein [Amnibacterium endophyticum]|uniref:DUF4397 domain-containing protein n=1 Tax=Amnibacterium endophyticum TaxID=2109337 RepID=A0ABW4L9A1_9MICO
MPLAHPRRLLAALVAASALILLPALPAHAAPSTGWARLAHLSPDTRSVDVRLAPLDTGGSVTRIDDVAYGAVSDYLALPAGEYAVAMRPAGSPESATPVIQTSMTVKAGAATTVAVFGRNSDLKVQVIPDDLRTPPAGDASVRVIQAATGGQPVTVTATSGDRKTLVSDAALGDVSAYSDVPAGEWELEATQGSATDTSRVDLRSGQIASLFVLEKADGGLTIKRVLDSASAGDLPKGYLATGGGFLVHQQAEEESMLLPGLAALLVAASAGTIGVAAARRRRAHA